MLSKDILSDDSEVISIDRGGFSFDFFSVSVTHYFRLDNESLIVKNLSVDSQWQYLTEIVQVLIIVWGYFFSLKLLVFWVVFDLFHVWSVTTELLLVIFVNFIIIVTKFCVVEDITQTFSESGSIDCLKVGFGFGVYFFLKLGLNFLPVPFIIVENLNFMGFFNVHNNFVNLSLFKGIWPLNLSLFQ